MIVHILSQTLYCRCYRSYQISSNIIPFYTIKSQKKKARKVKSEFITKCFLSGFHQVSSIFLGTTTRPGFMKHFAIEHCPSLSDLTSLIYRKILMVIFHFTEHVYHNPLGWFYMFTILSFPILSGWWF